MVEDTTTPYSISQLRRRKGVVRASITRLGYNVWELESAGAGPTTLANAQQLHMKLKELDSNYKDLSMILLMRMKP